MAFYWGRRASCLAVAALLVSPAAARATDGYFSHGYGTRAKAMAGAGVALPLDAMAGAVNPAGMVRIGTRLDVGAALFSPEREYRVTGMPTGAPGTFGLAPGGAESERTVFGVPYLAYNRKCRQDSSFGVLVFGNGGMNTTYPANAGNGTGTFYGGQAGVNLEQLFVSPTYARQMNDRLAVGVSATLAYQRFEARGLSSFGAFVADGTPDNLTNRGDDHALGLGARLGVLYDAAPKLTLGAAYQTQTTMQKFGKYADLFAGHGSFDIPAAFTAGLAYKTTPTSALAFDIQYIWYSRVHAVGNPFSNLFTGMQTQNPSYLLGGDNGPGFGWKDMTIYKLGYQWQAGHDWTLRAGVSYGKEPVPSSEVLFNILAPGVQEWHYTAGFSKRIGKRDELSVAVMYSPAKTVTGPNPLDAPGAQTISLRMHQLEVEAGWSRSF